MRETRNQPGGGGEAEEEIVGQLSAVSYQKEKIGVR